MAEYNLFTHTYIEHIKVQFRTELQVTITNHKLIDVYVCKNFPVKENSLHCLKGTFFASSQALADLQYTEHIKQCYQVNRM